MIKRITEPFLDGFFGSFKLALAVCLAVAAIGSAFVKAGPDAALNAARNLPR